MKTEKISVQKICMIAFAICINFVGGQIALFLKLPIYLDSIDVVLLVLLSWDLLWNAAQSAQRPADGNDCRYLFPVLCSGRNSSWFCDRSCVQKIPAEKWQIFPAALVITLPSTIISSCITAFLFGGITSSGSTVLVQLLAKTPLGMVGSCFVVQFITDYIDRVLCIAVAAVLITALRKSMKENFA